MNNHNKIFEHKIIKENLIEEEIQKELYEMKDRGIHGFHVKTDESLGLNIYVYDFQHELTYTLINFQRRYGNTIISIDSKDITEERVKEIWLFLRSLETIEEGINE